MSNRVRSIRKIIVGDRGWNIEIVAALPVCLINLAVPGRRSTERRKIVERGIAVMCGPCSWLEIACDGRQCDQVFGTGTHPEDNGATAGVANELHSFRTKLPGYPVGSRAHAVYNHLAVSIECPPSLLACPVRRGPEITGPSQVNGGLCRIAHQAQQHRIGRRRVHRHARLANPRPAITLHINAQVSAWLPVPKDEMPKSSGIEPTGFEVCFDGQLLPGRAQDTSRQLEQADDGNKQDCQALATSQSPAGAGSNECSIGSVGARPSGRIQCRSVVGTLPEPANAHYWLTQAAGALLQMLRCSRSTVLVFGITTSAFRVSAIACW